MAHVRLGAMIRRYTPTMLDVVEPASAVDIQRWETLCGGISDDYRAFLHWMGNRCPFLDGEDLEYAPEELHELVTEQPEPPIPSDLVLLGIDKAGGALDLYERRSDGVVARIGPGCGPQDKGGYIVENASLESYLLTAYVRNTLVPSHPFHFFAAVLGDQSRLDTFLRDVDDACARFVPEQQFQLPDLRFFGADFVVATHRRPGTDVIQLLFGAVERSRYETWYDLAFDRWQCVATPG